MIKIAELPDLMDKIKGKRIVAGYDGFVDTTVRPVSQAASGEKPAELFGTIREFGEFLISKAEKSCSIELQVESRHLGGNLPFLLSGVSALGLEAAGIGMLGAEGNIAKVFDKLPCSLYSFSPPGQSTCMEFRDGKVMLAPTVGLSGNGWDMVMEATEDKAEQMFAEADLFALVNWSELSFAHALWEDTYEQVLREKPADKDRFVFFDLCDISRKTTAEIDQVLCLIGKFDEKRTAILSLNNNEALVLSKHVLDGAKDLEKIADKIRVKYKISEVLIHTTRQAILAAEAGVFAKKTNYVERPVISTGAGDHFNAASCFALVMGLGAEERLVFANLAASLYVSSGISPSLEKIIDNLSL